MPQKKSTNLDWENTFDMEQKNNTISQKYVYNVIITTRNFGFCN